MSGADRARYRVESGREAPSACTLVSEAAIRRRVARAGGTPAPVLAGEPNNSLDLSICDYRGGGDYLKLTLDTAPSPVRRYYNLLAEARQLPNIGSGNEEDSRPQLVRDVGDDGTYGGTGAFWIPSRHDLTAIKDLRILSVAVFVKGLSNAEARQASATIARRAFAALERKA